MSRTLFLSLAILSLVSFSNAVAVGQDCLNEHAKCDAGLSCNQYVDSLGNPKYACSTICTVASEVTQCGTVGSCVDYSDVNLVIRKACDIASKTNICPTVACTGGATCNNFSLTCSNVVATTTTTVKPATTTTIAFNPSTTTVKPVTTTTIAFNPSTTTIKPVGTTTSSGGSTCKDNATNCAALKPYCSIATYSYQMYINCRKTCFCDTCKPNVATNCAALKAYCGIETYHLQMKENCYAQCFCN